MNAQIFDPRFNQLIDTRGEIEQIATGFKFLEGPAWNSKDGSLVFSDILGNSLFQWTATGGLKILRRNSYMANGNTYDRQGRLVTCEHATSRVTRIDFVQGGELEVLATHYQGKQLNSPNDIICKSDGTLYFTDPNSGRSPGYGVPRSQELSFQGVYRLHPNDLSLVLVVDDFSKPNGLCFSCDEKRLFINDTDRGHIRVFNVNADGTLGHGRIWAELTPVPGQPGVADGMKIDQAGNLYCTGPGGIHVFDQDAHLMGIIHMPEQTANLAWGDEGCSSLYITASSSLYRLRTKVPGVAAY